MVNVHIDEIINLTSVKGSNYGHFLEFYKKVSKNLVALQTLGKSDRQHGFVMPGLRLTSCCRLIKPEWRELGELGGSVHGITY